MSIYWYVRRPSIPCAVQSEYSSFINVSELKLYTRFGLPWKLCSIVTWFTDKQPFTDRLALYALFGMKMHRKCQKQREHDGTSCVHNDEKSTCVSNFNHSTIFCAFIARWCPRSNDSMVSEKCQLISSVQLLTSSLGSFEQRELTHYA